MLYFKQIAGQLDPASTLLGAGAGFLFSLIIALALLARLRKQLLITEMHLDREQDEKFRLGEEARLLQEERDALRRENTTLGKDNAALQAGCIGLEQQLLEREAVLDANYRQLEQRFELLAGEILTEKGKLIHQQNESAMQLLLKPLHQQLQEFKHRVDDVYDRESRDRLNVLNAINNLHQLNQQLSTDAVRLTEALQGKSKLQGQWGEMILEKLLEQSGLRKGVEFEPQASRTTESGGRQQPDIIVHLPENKHIIIDAKVSLKAFSEAHGEQDKERQRKSINRHLDSVKKHITSLAGKKYHQLVDVESMDFVLLFIPIEPAFQLVLETDPDLLTSAMRKQVILCSPSTLLATLRTIHHIWKLELQNRNGLIIAKQAGNLYDKLVGFIESFEEVGMRLDQSRQAWEIAHKRLSTGRGNLVGRAEMLKELGVQSDRELADVLQK